MEFQQVTDFLDESNALFEIIKSLDDPDFEQATLFKQWTIDDILQHLHIWNRAADMALHDQNAFTDYIGEVYGALRTGELRRFERAWLNDLRGQALLYTWRDFYTAMATRFAKADPKQRVRWAGPDMSVRSSVTARLMETWAHGQAIYDLLGIERVDTDRIRNIVILGVNTFGWTFGNRNLPVPETTPRLKLTAPSGAIWRFNETVDDDLIEGSATEFCQVVTQVRHVDDTQLSVTGAIATQWMSIAQCFAGLPVEPPAPGTRYRRTER